MSKYKFLYFENNSKELHNFIDKYGDNINKIIRSCFNIDYYEDNSWIEEFDCFFIMHNKKVVAFAGSLYKNVIKYDLDVAKYNLIKLDDKDSQRFNKNKRSVNIGPLIESLCRDSNPKYRGVGTLLLSKICNYYKEIGIKNIYLVPESSKFKIYGNNDCGVEVEKEKYLTSQKELAKYYYNYGFKELKYHYEVDICGDIFTNDSMSIVLFPIFYKKL